jgi:ferredoxin--NADP+ reductase
MADLDLGKQTLRVAVIGAGPAGFYTAEQLLKQNEFPIEVDLYDRLPTPYGLVRGGVAPDHQKIKSVTKVYERTAHKPGFRYFGHVDYGTDITLDDLKKHYHQIVFATGTQSGKLLKIPGADLLGNHPASDFVSWYNGHPDYRDLIFDLSHQRATIIGMGNVALDIARMLALTPEELRRTDMADYAIEALSGSNIQEITILGRRGPLQAAFTTPELKELDDLAGADVRILPEEVSLDPLSLEELNERADRTTVNKVRIIQDFAAQTQNGKPKTLTIRFLISPVEIYGDGSGQVNRLRLVKNKLFQTEVGTLRPLPTDEYEEMPAGLVFHAIGYKGVPLPGVPFNERWGTIPNQQGRVVDPGTEKTIPGIYAVGWIKRGPSGVIGTNKLDAIETVDGMLADLREGLILDPPYPDANLAEDTVRQNQPRYVVFRDWKHLDNIEVARGEAENRPRVKFTEVEVMLEQVEQVQEPAN